MIFHIALSDQSARFLSSGDLNTWSSAAHRGFTNDGSEVTNEYKKMNAAAKAALLDTECFFRSFTLLFTLTATIFVRLSKADMI